MGFFLKLCLSLHDQHGGLKEEMLCDRLVVGRQDLTLVREVADRPQTYPGESKNHDPAESRGERAPSRVARR